MDHSDSKNVKLEQMRKKTTTTIPRIVLMAVTVSAICPTMMYSAPVDFEVRAGDDKFRLSETRGKCVAIQFLPPDNCAGCLDYVNASMQRRDELAGFLHVFLMPATEEIVSSFRSSFRRDESETPPIYADADGDVAARFGIPRADNTSPPVPVTILIDPNGAEVYRHIGAHVMDLPSIDKLYAQVERHSINPDLAQFNLNKGEPALQGYDPVAYFESMNPMKGRSDLISRYRGVRYQFANGENRRKFAADPARYLPTYGGWCATAMADGRKVEIDPTNFKITDGRLFLFYKGLLGNARKEWDKNEAVFTRRADENWSKIAPRERQSGQE